MFKEIVDAQTHGRTDGQWTTDNVPSQRLTLSTLCSGELKMTVSHKLLKILSGHCFYNKLNYG